MEILNKETIGNLQLVITKIQVPDEGVVVVKDLYDCGSLMESQYLSKNGYAIEDPALIEKIESFMDSDESNP